MKRPLKRVLAIALAALLLSALLLAWQGYLQPGLLLDFLNLRYCG